MLHVFPAVQTASLSDFRTFWKRDPPTVSFVSCRPESAMDREPSCDHHVQHRALLVQQVRLWYRCRSLHGRSYTRRGHRGVMVSQRVQNFMLEHFGPAMNVNHSQVPTMSCCSKPFASFFPCALRGRGRSTAAMCDSPGFQCLRFKLHYFFALFRLALADQYDSAQDGHGSAVAFLTVPSAIGAATSAIGAVFACKAVGNWSQSGAMVNGASPLPR